MVTPDEPRASRMRSWSKRLRVAAALVTLISGIISGALATVALFSESHPIRERVPKTGESLGASWETWVCRPSSALR